MTERAGHWDRVYRTTPEEALSWYQQCPEPALTLIRSRVAPGDPLLDVGAGTSCLVDHLLDAGLGPITLTDLSAAALEEVRARLGDRAEAVTFCAADITETDPPGPVALWHDRAVLHFLTEDADRAAYLRRMAATVRPGGTAILSGFAPDGPARCSGLPVRRFDAATLQADLARHAPGTFTRASELRHTHRTPAGTEQRFCTLTLQRS